MKLKSESEVTQSCLTLSDPVDCSLPGSSVHGIFQARVLEWGAMWLPGIKVGNGSQGVGVGVQMLQLCLQAVEGGPAGAGGGPAVRHEFREGGGAVHGRGQPVPVLNALHYLQRGAGQEASPAAQQEYLCT